MATDKSFFVKNKIAEGKYSVIERRMKRDVPSADCRTSAAAVEQRVKPGHAPEQDRCYMKMAKQNVAETLRSSKTVGCLYFAGQLPSMTFPIIAETETLKVTESIINKGLPGMATHQSSSAKSLQKSLL